MFWKVIKWGGTLAILLLVLVALIGASVDEPQNHPAPAASGSKFNF